MLKRASDETLLFVLIGLSLIGIGLHRASVLDPVESVFLDVIAPIQQFVGGGIDRIGYGFNTLQRFDKLEDENVALRELVDQLMIENVKLKDETREIGFLRQELAFARANPSFNIQSADILGGRVVSFDPSAPQAFIVIAVGERDGIKSGMPVARAGALVGQIFQVGQYASRVLMITDPRSQVNARIQSSGTTGIVTGNVDGTLRMTHVPQDANVNVGDIVITSGYGGNFPRRLAIGQVLEIQKRDVDTFQTAYLKPAADFSALEIISVITNFQPTSYELPEQ